MANMNNDLEYNINEEEEIYERIKDKTTLSKNRIKIMICMVFVFMYMEWK